MKSWFSKPLLNLELLYRGSINGFKVKDFHDRCDDKGPTLTVLKSQINGKIIGGFASVSWKSPVTAGIHVSDDKSFIFSITDKTKLF